MHLLWRRRAIRPSARHVRPWLPTVDAGKAAETAAPAVQAQAVPMTARRALLRAAIVTGPSGLAVAHERRSGRDAAGRRRRRRARGQAKRRSEHGLGHLLVGAVHRGDEVEGQCRCLCERAWLRRERVVRREGARLGACRGGRRTQTAATSAATSAAAPLGATRQHWRRATALGRARNARHTGGARLLTARAVSAGWARAHAADAHAAVATAPLACRVCAVDAFPAGVAHAPGLQALAVASTCQAGSRGGRARGPFTSGAQVPLGAPARAFDAQPTTRAAEPVSPHVTRMLRTVGPRASLEASAERIGKADPSRGAVARTHALAAVDASKSGGAHAQCSHIRAEQLARAALMAVVRAHGRLAMRALPARCTVAAARDALAVHAAATLALGLLTRGAAPARRALACVTVTHAVGRGAVTRAGGHVTLWACEASCTQAAPAMANAMCAAA